MDLNQLFSIAKDETTVGELRRMLGETIPVLDPRQVYASDGTPAVKLLAGERVELKRPRPPAKARAPKAERKPRAPRASAEDVQALLDRVLDALPSEGLTSVYLQKALDVERAPLAKALARGLKVALLRSEGEKRAKTYFRV